MTRSLIQKIYSYDKQMTKSQMKIAKAVCNDYGKIAFLSIHRLAKHIGVSESTILRFADLFGYHGYKEFQKELQHLYELRVPPYRKQEQMRRRIREADIVEHVMGNDIGRIKHLMDNINRESLYSAATELIDANKIYIIGARSSKPVAEILYHNLSLLLDNVRFIEPLSHEEIYEQMLLTGPTDAFVAISLPRYSNAIENATKFAKQRKATIIAITDSEFSPISGYADVNIFTHDTRCEALSSVCAAVSIINTLSMLVYRRAEKKATAMITTLGKLWENHEESHKNARGKDGY